MTILRSVAAAMSLLGFMMALACSWFWPPAAPFILYFGLFLFGAFALLPRRHCWAIAIILQTLPFFFLRPFLGNRDSLFIIAFFALHAALWWLSVGYASLRQNNPMA